MIRFIAAVRTAVFVTVWLAGGPIVLTMLAGSPLPHRWPTAAQVQAWLEEPLDPAYAPAAARLLAWLVWLLLAAAICAALAAQLRHPHRIKIIVRLPPPMQGLAAALLGTAAITTTIPTVPMTHTAVTGTVVDPHRQTIEQPPMAAPTITIVGNRHRAGPGVTRPTPVLSATAGHGEPAAGSALMSVAYQNAGRRPVYRVARGDWMVTVADRYLGSPDRYQEIARLNPGWEHRDHRFPDHWEPGWTIVLPDDANDRGARPHATGHLVVPAKPTEPGNRQPTSDESTAAHSSRSGAPSVDRSSPALSADPNSSPSTTASPPTDPDGVVDDPTAAGSRPQDSDVGHQRRSTTHIARPGDDGTARSAPTTTGTLPQAGTPHTVDPAAQPAEDDHGWIEVTGGFMTAGLAAGLVYAAARVWQRRRHHYRPAPITSATLDDPDLATPLAALTRLRHSVRRAAPELLNPASQRQPTVHEYLTAPVKPPLPPTGPSGAELAGLAALPVTGGVGLDGPAALDAARAALVATLTSGDPNDPHAQGRIVIPAATLTDLLGVPAADVHPTPRLTIASTFADALATVEEEIIRRSRILAEQDAAHVADVREQWTFGEPLPQLLLIADTPDDGRHPRVATAVRLGSAVDIGAVLIGAWPPGTTLTVAVDGSTQGGNGERVAVLDTAATADILAMLAEADEDTAKSPPSTPDPGHTDHTETHQNPPPPSAAAPPEQPRTASHAYGHQVPARVLGQPALLDADGQPVHGLRAKSLELLVYLVVHRSGATLNTVMEALWPDVSVSRATERLSTCVANLRTTIRSLAQARAGQPDLKLEPVINTGGHYHLDPTLLDVDWWTVLDAYTAVAAAADDDTRLTHLRTAIDAAHGGALADGCTYEWIDTDREHVRRRLIKTYTQAASLLTDTDPDTSRRYYDTACSLDPLSDDLARHAMRAAARLGDAEGVRHRLAVLRRELDDAGLDIDADTEQLADDLLRTLNTTVSKRRTMRPEATLPTRSHGNGGTHDASSRPGGIPDTADSYPLVAPAATDHAAGVKS